MRRRGEGRMVLWVGVRGERVVLWVGVRERGCEGKREGG